MPDTSFVLKELQISRIKIEYDYQTRQTHVSIDKQKHPQDFYTEVWKKWPCVFVGCIYFSVPTPLRRWTLQHLLPSSPTWKAWKYEPWILNEELGLYNIESRNRWKRADKVSPSQIANSRSQFLDGIGEGKHLWSVSMTCAGVSKEMFLVFWLDSWELHKH